MEDPRRQSLRRLRQWGPALCGGGLVMALAGAETLRAVGLSLAFLGAVVLATGLAVRVEPLHREREREAAGLARWSLPADAWQAWLEDVHARARREGGRAALVVTALGVGLAGLVALAGGSAAGALALAGGMALLGAFVGAGAAAIFRRQVAELRRAPPEVVLAPGFARVGHHTFRWHRRAPFLPGGWELVGSRLRSGTPPVLELELRWRSLGVPRPFPRVRPRLPVAPGQHAELERLLARSAALLPP